MVPLIVDISGLFAGALVLFLTIGEAPFLSPAVGSCMSKSATSVTERGPLGLIALVLISPVFEEKAVLDQPVY